MSYKWNDFLKEGDELYIYMINNYQSMFENNSKIKHFSIIDGIYSYIIDINKIMEIYGKMIENELIKFIKSEYDSKSLFDKLNWKPFRDNDNIVFMSHYGYRTLFKFKKYYFQLGISNFCELSECNICNHNYSLPHFILAIYGWVDDISNELQPYRYVSVSSDNIMPNWDWERK